jgi:hypothetical protein
MMDVFYVKLDRAAQSELYADISPEFLAFIFIEAIFSIIQNNAPHKFPIVDDPVYYCDDPDSQFETSVEYLLAVMADCDKKDGVYVSEEDYQHGSENHTRICTKLGSAIESIQHSNCSAELMVIRELFNQPAYMNQVKFSATHLPDRVFFALTSDLGLDSIPRV